jgi:hypothetical protein
VSRRRGTTSWRDISRTWTSVPRVIEYVRFRRICRVPSIHPLRCEVEDERTSRVRAGKPVSYLEVDCVNRVGHEDVEVLPGPAM